MSVVVSDTSPVRAFVHLGRLDVLPALFGEVLIPPAVVDELANPAGQFAPVDVRTMSELRIQAPHDAARVAGFLRNLHLGESEALALALEVRANAVLIDESAGRAAAIAAGLQVVGVLGLLSLAKQRGLTVAMKPSLDRLIRDLNFYVSASLYSQALRDAGEAP